MNDGILTGVRVLDVAQLLPGPWAAQVLADLGADVTKIEPPGGDGARTIRGELFAATNRNKRRRLIDLKSAEGRQSFLDLATDTDVLIEGYRPGVTERLGIGYADVRRINPGIVYCSVTGYGRVGDNSQSPGHDINYLAASGALSFSGHWGEAPRRPGVPMADLGSASFAVIAIMSALYDRAVGSREGCHLDVSMTDTMTAWAAARGGARLERGPDDRDHLYPTNDVFQTRDGRWLALGAVEEKFWESARHVLAVAEPELAGSKYSGLVSRMRFGDEVNGLIRSAFLQKNYQTWMDLFRDTDAPVSSVLSLSEVADEALRSNDAGPIQELDGERHAVFPVRRNGTVMGSLRSPSPPLSDEHELQNTRTR